MPQNTLKVDGLTEIAGLDIGGRVKKRGWTLQDWTLKDWTLTDWTMEDRTLTDWTLTDWILTDGYGQLITIS